MEYEEEIKYPWSESKRAWIFYLKEIKADRNKIVGELEGNVYFLDCETAKLSVWMKEDNIFTAVGISSLLEQIELARSGRIQKLSRGTRILYKGIELQNTYMEHDTELLEYIDIKRELNREFINISRYGFTEKGERFFKEVLYPKLLEVIRKVLDEIKNQAEQEIKSEKESFIDRICEITQNLCTGIEKFEKSGDMKASQKKQEKLISLVITSAVLSYYATRDEWDIMEGFDERREHNSVWTELVRRLNEKLDRHGRVLEILADKTILFNIKAINENYSEHLIRGDRESSIHFLKIFLPDMHWAILQKRKNQFDVWTSYLILLKKDKDGTCGILDKLITFPRTAENDVILENWGEQMCGSVEKISFWNAYGMQVLLDWMLKTIPTVGLFSNEDGNTRINVLYNRIYPSIYMNNNFKSSILERITEYAREDNIQRFSTITWQRRERIGMNNLPFAVFFVKRGYMSVYSYHKSIVPIDGNLLKLWGKILTEKDNSDIFRRFKILCEYMDVEKCLNEIRKEDYGNISNYWRSDSENVRLNISQEILSTVFHKIIRASFRPIVSVKELLSGDGERFQEWKNIYRMFAEMQARDFLGISSDKDGEMLEELKGNPEWASLCSAWIYLCFQPNRLLEGVNEITESYTAYINDEAVFKKEEKMLAYMEKNLRYSVDSDSIKTEMERYKNEWLNLAVSLERRSYLKMIDELRKNYATLTQQISSAYEEHRRQKK